MTDEGTQAHIDALAARVQALTAERDELRARLNAANARYRLDFAERNLNRRERDKAYAERDAARAELAAANARCAELEGTYWHEELGKVLIKNKALQATLDRVTALADEWNRDKPPRTASVFGRALRSAISGDGA